MAEQFMCRRTMRAVFNSLVCCGLVIGLFVKAQSSPVTSSKTPADGTTVKAPAYEVVSIKHSNAAVNAGGGWWNQQDGFRFRNMALRSLIHSAYGIIMESQVSGMPGWAETDPYDIDAKVDADTAAVWKNLPFKERMKQEQPMLQALLIDRCHFKAHQETKDLPVYDLVIAKGGLKMKEAPSDEQGYYGRSGGSSGSTFTAHATSVQSLAMSLSGDVSRIIVDKTGLGERKFDFELNWSPDEQRGADPANAGPSLFTVLEEQLGLKLVPSKGHVEVIVIDHIERPSPN